MTFDWTKFESIKTHGPTWGIIKGKWGWYIGISTKKKANNSIANLWIWNDVEPVLKQESDAQLRMCMIAHPALAPLIVDILKERS